MKRRYEKMLVTSSTCVIGRTLLSASSIVDATLMSVGQEIGLDYDLSEETDNNTCKKFYTDWE